MLHTALNVKRNGFAKQYSYDKADNRETFLAKAGAATIQSVSYAYDNQKRLYQVKENNALVGTYGYDANGNRSSLTLANGVITSYAYNKANWLTELTNAKGGATLSSYAYSYYADGNQRTKTDNNNRVSSYVYDGVGRLKSETESSGLGLAYAYDRWGNRKTLTATGAQAYGVAYDYDANNRLSAETKTVGADVVTTAYVYDANGNQKSWMRETLSPLGQGQGALSLSGAGAAFYEHDAFNRMTLAYVDGVTTNYAYRVDGLRNSKGTSAATLAHLWDGANIAADMSGGSLIASYVRGVNLLRSDAQAGQSYYLYNGHGDVTGLANASGALTLAYDYDAFGVEREIVGQNPSTNANPFRYSGEYFDAETDAYYLRARRYKPSIGRFLSEDPHWNQANMIYGDNPRRINEQQNVAGLHTYTYVPDINAIRQGGNLYAYCGNNPIVYVDENGEVWWVAVGALAGGTVGAGVDIYKQMRSGADWSSIDKKSVLIAAGSGAVSGALGATGVGLLGQVAGNALISGVESITRDLAYGKSISIDNALLNSAVGAVAGIVGGPGLQKGLVNTGYTVVNASQKYFYVHTFKYINPAVAQTMVKEFYKGLAKEIAYEIVVYESEVELRFQISK